ncbi:MAG: pentapeptide repeat-containing protein [Phycisphaeraceae bacterium]|nr:MAG: pentapeptide repeat-containing protein [Phycisphaeraceae bacterium]
MNLSDSTFGDEANLSGSTFGDEANLSGSTFGDEANLSGSTFGKGADLSFSTFGDRSNLSGSTFGILASLSGSTFGDGADLSGSIFGARANLSGSTFGKGANLSGSTFGHEADLSGSTFGDGAVFSLATFGTHADFSGTRLGFRADFFDCRFHAPGGPEGLVVASRHFPRTHAGRAHELLVKPLVHFGWDTVRRLGETRFLTLASYSSLVAVPLIVGSWPALRRAVESYNAADKPGSLPAHLDAPPLPSAWALAFFAALCVAIAHALYGYFAPESVQRASRDDFREKRNAEFRAAPTHSQRDLLIRAFDSLDQAARRLPEIRHPSFVKRHGKAVWVTTSIEELDRYSKLPDEEELRHSNACKAARNAGRPKPPPRPPLTNSPEEMRVIVIDEGAAAEYDLKAREKLPAASLSAAFYAAALFLLAWLTSDQVTAILVESGTIERGVIPNRWGPILIVLASAYAISALVWLVLRVRRGS